MTKTELIEALVMAIAARQRHTAEFLEMQPSLKAMYRKDALACLPLFVEFVAEWLEEVPQAAPMAAQISDRWREDMT